MFSGAIALTKFLIFFSSFFVCVQGFEWNKYNQTHYDTDNPPPKVVQGYKFNIFYPDLIDKHKTPEYTVVSALASFFSKKKKKKQDLLSLASLKKGQTQNLQECF